MVLRRRNLIKRFKIGLGSIVGFYGEVAEELEAEIDILVKVLIKRLINKQIFNVKEFKFFFKFVKKGKR